MKKSGPLSPGYGKGSNLPILKTSKLSPSASASKARTNARSTEDIPRSVRLSVSGGHGSSPARRANSPAGDNRQSGSAGVRYITEDMIKKMSKEDSFDMITSLNLTLSRDAGKKIKYIENLEKLKNLQVLNLSNNMIEKMEKLDRLTKLKELNLSYNSIIKIDGIENLVSLQVLNLTGNMIEHIPLWLSKKLRNLRILHVAQNSLSSLNELTKLKTLPDLFNISVSENPLDELSHSRLYLIFHLRNLEVIDGQSVAQREREDAASRFTQDEVQKLERELEEKENSFRKLEDMHSRSLQDGSMREAMAGDLKKKEKQLMDTIRDLNQELDTKDHLLSKKGKELSRANEKHYQLEQELAFFKIDKKFDSLGQGPPPVDASLDDSSQLDESPYIGRARYKANQYARESGNFNATPQKIEMHNAFSYDSQNLLSPRSNNNADNTFDSSGSQGEDVKKEHPPSDKNGANSTEERLRLLQEDLEATERKLLGATSELKYMGDIKPESQIPEGLLQSLREKLAKKMKNVNDMRDKASQIEEELEKKDKSIDRKCAELAQLKTTLQRLDRRDPQYFKLQDAVMQKEQQITESKAMENQLQNHLEGMVETITKETGEIKKIEDKLHDGGIEHTAELRYELGDIVDGLQDYLSTVRSHGDKKQIDIQKLLDEKHDYQDKIKNLEAELGVLDKEAANYRQMEHSFKELENALARADAQNASLKDQLAQTKQQEPMIEEKIEKTEAERQHLQRSLKDVERRTQNEKQQLERQLNQERERAEKASQKARDLATKEHELKRMTNQLESAKAMNASLKEQLEDQRRKMKDTLNDSFSPVQLKRRLKDMSSTLKRNRSPIEPEGPEDVVGKTFKDLQHHLQNTLNKSTREIDVVKKEKDRTDADLSGMREQLKKFENKLMKKEEQRQDEKMKREEEKKNTAAEIKKLQDEARQLRSAVKDAENRARRARSATKIVHKPESVSSRDTLNTVEKGLYDELQNELMDLKRLMQQREEDNSKKLLEIETEAKGLQSELGQRDKETQKEKMKQKQQEELQKERQEARLDVIAKDLDQAQHSANFLQQMLDEREYQLHNELQQADMSGQMVSMQEEELARLYEILEAQRNEIENLNGELDQMYHHGPSVGGFDDELWRLRNEVDGLKETLAMQTAYVQNMPNLKASAGVQVDSGIQGGRGSIGVDALQRPPLSRYQHPAMSMVPPGIPKANMGTSPDAGEQYRGGEWIGTERREQRTPPGEKMIKGKHFENEFIPSRSTKPNIKGISLDDMAINGPINNRRQFSANLPVFEPIQKPHFLSQPHLASTAPPDADMVDGQRRATYHSINRYQEPVEPMSHAASMPAVSSSKFRPVQGSTPAVPPQVSSHDIHQSSGLQRSPGQVYRPAPMVAAGSTHVPQSLPLGQVNQDMGQPHSIPGTYSVPKPVFPVSPVQPHYQDPVAAQAGPAVGQTQTGFQPVVASAPGLYGPGPSVQPPVNAVLGPPPAYNYVPAGPAQMLPYSSGRVYIPSGGTKPARYYYPSTGSIPMPAASVPQPVVSSPIRVLPGPPIAAGTPISYSPVRVNGYVDPISPIRPVAMESPSHGVTQAGHHTADGYLFCNVPEHHSLEDYISELQEKLRRLRAKISRSNISEEDSEDIDEEEERNRNDSHLIKRLKGELSERRDELESLDLAIERQKHNLRNMKLEERLLERERREAKDELHFIKTKNRRKRDDSTDDSFDEAMKKSRQKYIKDEIKCLEETLSKRKVQLRDADRILKECNTDLRDAREQARDTVQKYDDAKAGLQMAVSEASELERRATEAGIQLVKSSEQLSQIRSEVRNLDRKRQKQETLLREINQIISKKDAEFKDVDSKVRSSTQNLNKLQAELNAASIREKQTLSALRESEDVLAKRRSEISRLREQMSRRVERRDPHISSQKPVVLPPKYMYKPAEKSILKHS